MTEHKTAPDAWLDLPRFLRRQPIIRTGDEIDEVMDIAAARVDAGVSCAPGESFEAGVMHALGWVTDESYDPPLNPDDDARLRAEEAR